MTLKKDIASSSSLCRFRLSDEHLITDEILIKQISLAFDENRSFSFFPNPDLIRLIGGGASLDDLNDGFIDIRNGMFDGIAGSDITLKRRLLDDSRLSAKLIRAIGMIHRAIAEEDSAQLAERRFVLIREKTGSPTIYHLSGETTVISRVGQGPLWKEMPSIYLGLNIFEALQREMKRGEDYFFRAFRFLLRIEERAIETGYTHTQIFPPEVSLALNDLVEEVIRVSTMEVIEFREAPPEKEVARFTPRHRERIVDLLDARMKRDALNFDYEKNMKAINSLERLARRYKKSGDADSLREVVRLLVAASGHDIHEVRNRANFILERLLAPKEYDAPLASVFHVLKAGDAFSFSFRLPKKNEYYLRLYSGTGDAGFFLEKDISFRDLHLKYDDTTDNYHAKHRFADYGHYDYTVIRKKRKNFEWQTEHGNSGRINVIPDVRGEIILEIFPDIHGHTRAYWMDSSGHPGLVYNENGEVIRLGRFSDIAAHLQDLKSRYMISVIYLLGVQKRGSNYEDWAHEATSPSPFSPMSLVEIEPYLGGEAEFRELVEKAHGLQIKIVVDVVPHLNRRSTELPENYSVQCYDGSGNLVVRASTDGRYGSWNDGKLLNYRKFEVWEWLANSIVELVERYDIDGIRFDSAHSVPIMMKRNNYPLVYDRERTHEEMLEGLIIVNDREDDHLVTTGYYDAACRDMIAVPLHYYLMRRVEHALKKKGKAFFINLAECYWGHERFLTRVGIIPYNSSLFKICENIIHGKTDVREIYHIYDNFYPSVLPEGAELLGILGNHDERRALNTFGHRGLRAAVALTIFMSSIIMDYEGSAEGEGWKVFLDNIYVNWNQFEYAAHRSLERFYHEWYRFQRNVRGEGYLIWANNTQVAASIKFIPGGAWIGVFNFSDHNQTASLQFDNPVLPISDSLYYRVADPLYSPITGQYNHINGREMKVSRLHTVVSYTERVKLLKLEVVEKVEELYPQFLRDSFFRMTVLSDSAHFLSNFFFGEFCEGINDFERFSAFITDKMKLLFWEQHRGQFELGIKRAFFHAFLHGKVPGEVLFDYIRRMAKSRDEVLKYLGGSLAWHHGRGSLVFMSAEAEPFSKSGGLANVVYELPRELVKHSEEVYVITGMYRFGDEKSVKKMRDAITRYKVSYTGVNVRFRVLDAEYQVGVHLGNVDGVKYFLLDHYEFFDGLYWGVTGAEKMRRRVAFARACAEVIVTFGLRPHFTFTNDAYAGLFSGIVRADHVYAENPNFRRTTFLHIIHNGGWQYFDAYHRYENGFDLFSLFNLPGWRASDFTDPVFPDRLNCMASGIRLADRTITVSPSYARQIEYACDGLERILHDVIGISNAIGSDFRERINERFNAYGFREEYFPKLAEYMKKDRVLAEKVDKRYPEIAGGMRGVDSIADPERRYIVTRMANKLMIQLQKGLKVDPDLILASMIHRVTDQKGFQLLLDCSEGLFKHLGFQAIIGGAISSGDRKGEELAHGLYQVGQFYSDRVSVSFGFQDVAVPLLASDIFLMPSMNEPGGISQLEAFACGCLVVARATGGLRDTVFPVRLKDSEIEGNGFLFSDYSAWSFYDAMERAHGFFLEHGDHDIYTARVNAEDSVYYWDRPAGEYIEQIYRIKEIIRIL